MTTDPTYLLGPDRIVCTRSVGCAGVTLMAAVERRPMLKIATGINGTRWRRLTAAQVAVEREWAREALGHSAICECEQSLVRRAEV
jgi:hypothetical protein